VPVFGGHRIRPTTNLECGHECYCPDRDALLAEAVPEEEESRRDRLEICFGVLACILDDAT